LSPVSAARANGVAWRTRYAAVVRSWLAILVTLAACHDQELERLTAAKAEVCSCKTASCAEAAIKRLPPGTSESTDRMQAHRRQVLAREMIECLAKLQAAERPTTDPDAEDSEAEPPGTASPVVPPPTSPPGTTAPAAAQHP
jgi:hypothetical protein